MPKRAPQDKNLQPVSDLQETASAEATLKVAAYEPEERELTPDEMEGIEQSAGGVEETEKEKQAKEVLDSITTDAEFNMEAIIKLSKKPIEVLALDKAVAIVKKIAQRNEIPIPTALRVVADAFLATLQKKPFSSKKP